MLWVIIDSYVQVCYYDNLVQNKIYVVLNWVATQQMVSELRFSIHIDDYSKYGKHQVWSWEIQWQEQFLSLAKKDEISFDSARSLQGVIGKGKETLEDGQWWVGRDDVKVVVRSILICQMKLFIISWWIEGRDNLAKIRVCIGKKNDE